MRTLTLRTAALVAALPLALSSLAACGDSSSQATATDPQAGPSSSHTAGSAPPVAKTIDGADFYALVKDATEKITTARFSMQMDLSGQSVPVDGVIDMTGDSPAMQMSIDTTGMGTPTEMRLVDRTMYVEVPGAAKSYYKIDLDDPQGPLGALGGDAFSNLDPGSLTSQMSPQVFKKVVDRGSSTVGGRQLHHYAVTLDLGKAPRLKGLPAGVAVPKTAAYDVWLDSDGRIARFVMLVKKSVRISATYSDYDTAPHVTAPPASQVVAFPGASAQG